MVAKPKPNSTSSIIRLLFMKKMSVNNLEIWLA